MAVERTFEGRRCVVTGANGFVGSHLARRLVERGADARALVRTTSDLTLLEDVDAERVFGDVTDLESLEAAFEGADYVFHVAGVVKALKLETFDKVNADGSENVCRAILTAAPKLRRLVHVSSLAAAGPAIDGQPKTEAGPDEPVSIYGKSKLAGEERVRQHGDAIRYTIVRPPFVYGPGDTATLELFTALKRHLKGVITGGPRLYSFIYVADLVDGILEAAANDKATGETFFITSSEVMSYKELQEEILRALGTWAMRVPIPAFVMPAVGRMADWSARRRGKPAVLSRQKVAEALPKAWLCSPDKAREMLGFEAQTTLNEGLKVQAEWYREHGWI